MRDPPRQTVPPPIANAFVVCREIIEDRRTNDFVLIGPISGIHAPSFPLRCRLAIYVHLTCGHDNYEMALQLRRGKDEPALCEEVLWQWCCPDLIELVDPMKQHRLALHDVVLDFGEPGRYDLVLSANGVDLARHAFYVRTLPSL